MTITENGTTYEVFIIENSARRVKRAVQKGFPTYQKEIQDVKEPEWYSVKISGGHLPPHYFSAPTREGVLALVEWYIEKDQDIQGRPPRNTYHFRIHV